MAAELKQMIHDALELSDKDRATLAGLLITSLDPADGSDLEIEEAWLVETKRRWSEIKSGKVSTIPWAEVEAKLRGK